MLKPATEWHMDYAPDKCRLSRAFGSGENGVAFIMERYDPGDPFFLVVAGAPLANTNLTRLTLRFGPEGLERTEHLLDAKLGELPAVMVTGMTLVELPVEVAARTSNRTGSRYVRETGDDEPDVLGQSLTPTQESAISWLEIVPRGKPPIRIALGSMGKPMAAMRACTEELLGHWGIDLEAHRSLTRAVTPKGSPANWIASGDYPRELLAKGAQGLVQFRLIVGQDGKPTECFIQESTRPKGFDDAVCKSMMRNARFDPALDKDGVAIKSYWRSSVRFQM